MARGNGGRNAEEQEEEVPNPRFKKCNEVERKKREKEREREKERFHELN